MFTQNSLCARITLTESEAIMRIDGIEYVTTTQAAKILGVSAGRVRQLVASGILGSRTVGKNNLVPLASVQWYAENKKEAGRPPKIKGLTP